MALLFSYGMPWNLFFIYSSVVHFCQNIKFNWVQSVKFLIFILFFTPWNLICRVRKSNSCVFWRIFFVLLQNSVLWICSALLTQVRDLLLLQQPAFVNAVMETTVSCKNGFPLFALLFFYNRTDTNRSITQNRIKAYSSFSFFSSISFFLIFSPI